MERWTFDAATYLMDLETHRGGGNRADGVAPRPPEPTHPELWDPATYPDPFDAAYGATLKQPHDGVPPQEKGPKDTVIANPGEITRIRLKFDLPTSGPGTETPARYVFHCHILEHEENEMMHPLLITSAPAAPYRSSTSVIPAFRLPEDRIDERIPVSPIDAMAGTLQSQQRGARDLLGQRLAVFDRNIGSAVPWMTSAGAGIDERGAPRPFTVVELVVLDRRRIERSRRSGRTGPLAAAGGRRSETRRAHYFARTAGDRPTRRATPFFGALCGLGIDLPSREPHERASHSLSDIAG